MLPSPLECPTAAITSQGSRRQQSPSLVATITYRREIYSTSLNVMKDDDNGAKMEGKGAETEALSNPMFKIVS